jgi:hypothetical protein
MNTKTNIIQLERKTERWANRIREAHSKTVESIIETGRLLIEAKADCDHGEWGEITGETTGNPLLPFSFTVARRYMIIAKHPFLSNRAHAHDLPSSWDTLYQLSQLPTVDLEAELEAGRIHPDMTRADAVALRKPEQPPKPPAQAPAEVVNHPAHTAPEQQPEAPAQQLTPEQRQWIEDAPKRLVKAIENHEIQMAEIEAHAIEAQASSERLKAAGIITGEISEQDMNKAFTECFALLDLMKQMQTLIAQQTPHRARIRIMLNCEQKQRLQSALATLTEHINEVTQP